MSPQLLDSVLLRTDFPELKLQTSGKVRDVYGLDNERLLFVATDRISAFDYVLATGIPHKGSVLTQISLFWFEFLRGLVPNHVITAEVDQYPTQAQKYADQLRSRSMVVPPATKAATGHDENIPFEEMTRIVGVELSQQLRDITLKIYKKAADYALQKGIIIADTKFEFGMTSKGITLADEVLTPDSSRFWPADKYQPGRAQDSYDKQYVRDYLEEIRWNKQPPAPALPTEVARRTSEKYLEAFHQLTGRELDV
jgi:phosphoribosylaminoimidazole-succinocarboxamide synthase